MIRAGLFSLLMAAPAGAEIKLPEGVDLCLSVSGKISDLARSMGDVNTVQITRQGDWCVITDLKVDLVGQYVPDWHIDRLRFRGSALTWIADGSTVPEGLEIAVEGLRLVVQTGDARMDWLFAAQARPNAIDAEAALSWDKDARVLRLEGLSIDFPGENLVQASARVTGVDLSSAGAMQMSLTGFALTEAEVQVTTHGLFEWYVLMSLGSVVLPSEGDMDAAFAGLQADLKTFVADLPGTSFSADSKAALEAFVESLPNPAGDLRLTLTAEPGLGPVRFGGYAIYGVQQMLSDLDILFQGVTVDVGWSEDNAP